MADGVSVFDGLIIQGNNLLALLDAAKAQMEAVSLDTTSVDNSKIIVNAVLPMAYEQIEIVAGDGKTKYYYRCNECSLTCEKGPYKFLLLEHAKIKCELKGTDGAKFEKYNEVTDIS